MNVCSVPTLSGPTPLFLVVTDISTYNVRAANEDIACEMVAAREAASQRGQNNSTP